MSNYGTTLFGACPHVWFRQIRGIGRLGCAIVVVLLAASGCTSSDSTESPAPVPTENTATDPANDQSPDNSVKQDGDVLAENSATASDPALNDPWLYEGEDADSAFDQPAALPPAMPDLPLPLTVIERKKILQAEVDVDILDHTVLLYHVSVEAYPTNAQGLQALVDPPSDPASADLWCGPYTERDILVDPWGNPYEYRNPGLFNPDRCDIYSRGPDGIADTDDDIGNWETPGEGLEPAP